MQVFIAEKPSLGRAIAEVIGITEKRKNYIICRNDTVVTWCFGHLFELAPPNVYLNKPANARWELSDLPIIPKNWKKILKKDAKGQFETIKELVKKADVVINAGDPDREGQLLVDEVLERVDPPKTVKRIWLQALDRENILKALKSMESNQKYLPYKLSAEARSKADWLVGMNFTRFFTLKANARRVISVGRVQTPTLALVAERDKKIENFKPHDYYIVKANIKKDGKSITAVYAPKEKSKGFDEEGRLIDKQLALKVKNEISQGKANAISLSTAKKTEIPPLPYNLATLQKMASSKYGLTAAQTLQIAQNLYEKKLTTYPRTDCQYLADEQHGEAKKIISSIKSVSSFAESMAESANFSIKHPAFNSKKITAHTAIIPTGDIKNFNSLSDKEKKIYLEIVKAYLCLFQEKHEYYQIKAEFDINGYRFTAAATNVIKIGWKKYCSSVPKESEIPAFSKGDILNVANATIETKQTTPPPRFTDGTLIEAMSHIHRFIDDEQAKKVLKENDGIGTEATRAQIIETLVKRGFLKRQGKQIISTNLGREIVNQLPDWIKDPVMTARWERGLNGILQGTVRYEEFLQKQIEFIKKKLNENPQITVNAETVKETIGKCSCGGDVTETPKTYKCSKCGKYLFKTIFGKKLTQKQALALLQDKQIEVKGLKSKKGKKFSAKLKLVKDGEKWKTELEF